MPPPEERLKGQLLVLEDGYLFWISRISILIGIGNQIASPCIVQYRVLPSLSSWELGSVNGKNGHPRERKLQRSRSISFGLSTNDKAPSTVWSVLTFRTTAAIHRRFIGTRLPHAQVFYLLRTMASRARSRMKSEQMVPAFSLTLTHVLYLRMRVNIDMKGSRNP